jgi:hypothetical protein
MRQDQESEIAVIGAHREPNVDRHLAVKLGLVQTNAIEVLGYFAGALPASVGAFRTMQFSYAATTEAYSL